MAKFVSLLIFVAVALSASAAFAHGVVGDYIFLEPLVAEDPTPANELDIPEPSWVKSRDANTYSVNFSFEKVLYADDNYMPRFSVGAGSGWLHQSPYQGASTEGFGDLDMFAKWAFYYSEEHELLTSIAAITQVPAGDASVEEQSHTSLGPELLWEKGMGDLPNRPFIEYLRPLGFQGDFGYLPALGGHASHLMFADQVIEYSIPYLSNSVRDLGLKAPFRNLFAFTEFNYSQLMAGPSGQTYPDMLATPGIAYVGYHFELSVGTQIPLNNASIPGTHAAVIALLDIFYDSIIPKLGNWTTNRGFGE